MATKKWILYVGVLIIIIKQIQTACVCDEKGTDECAACSDILVVRPKPKYGKKPDIPLPPIGDSCWCSRTLIEPALLPKPCPKQKPPPPPCVCKPEKPYAPAPYAVPPVNYQPKDDSLPADPISVSLAIQAGKAIAVPEAKLAYGFVQKPIDGLPKIFFSTVKEENLYALKNDVITLKKPMAPPPEEDYPEPEDEEPAPEADDPPILTYKQLGYVVEQFKNPKFQKVHPSYSYTPAEPPAEAQYEVDCGFRPGRIAKYKPPKKYGYINDC